MIKAVTLIVIVYDDDLPMGSRDRQIERKNEHFSNICPKGTM